ncbi:hypothetical protein [Algoriphagus jejuensis]
MSTDRTDGEFPSSFTYDFKPLGDQEMLLVLHSLTPTQPITIN